MKRKTPEDLKHAINNNPDLFCCDNGDVFGHNVSIGGGMTASGWIGNVAKKEGHYKRILSVTKVSPAKKDELI